MESSARLDVRQFFRLFWELRPWDEVLEDIFALAWASKGGFTYPIEQMEESDRDWFLRRTDRQLRLEEKAMNKK